MTGPEAGDPVIDIYRPNVGGVTYRTFPQFSLLAFRHGTGTQLATGKSVTFTANSGIFGVSGVAFASTFSPDSNGNMRRDLSVATGTGNNAFQITGAIPDPVLALDDPNLKNRPDIFVKPTKLKLTMFARMRSARGVNIAFSK
jgi:hypothetical protein